jgi:4-diphosphocytidyl-2-C-methyl-D-erythritol kinase
MQTKPSTSWAYSILEEDEMGRSMDRYERLLQCIERGDITGIAGNMHNDFELPMQRRFPIIGEMKSIMEEEGALRTLLAGSGLSVFGIFTDTASMTRAMKKLQGKGHRCFETHTMD